MTDTIHNTREAADDAAAERAARRAAIERLIGHYPDMPEADLHRIFDYYRNEADARDRAAIRANRRIRRPYRQLCRDHKIDTLPLINAGVGVGIVFLLVLGVLALLFG